MVALHTRPESGCSVARNCWCRPSNPYSLPGFKRVLINCAHISPLSLCASCRDSIGIRGLSWLKQSQGIAVWIFGPRRLADRRCRNMVNRLDCAHVELVEHDAPINQYPYIGSDVSGPEAHLGVVGFVRCATAVHE